MKNETVPVKIRMATQGQIGEVHCTLIQGVPELTFEEAQTIIGDKSVLVNEVAAVFSRLFLPPSRVETTHELPTTLACWFPRAEEFANACLGVKVNFQEMFNLTDDLLGKNLIPVFDPGTLTNRDAIDGALKSQHLTVYEEADMMEYTGSAAGKTPTLHLIANSIRPDGKTMGKSPNQLREMTARFLSLRGYMLAFGLHCFVTREYLDPETFTWFLENRLPGGSVAYGYWYPARRRVRFSWGYPGYGNGASGARAAISVSLRT